MNEAAHLDVNIDGRRFSPSGRYIANSVIIVVDTKSDEFLENPRTGHRTRTGRFNSVSPPLLIDFNLRSSRPRDIRELLRNRLGSSHRWICAALASDISTAANDLRFRGSGFSLTVSVTITYENVVVMPDPPIDEALSLRAELLRMVLLGKVGGEESKSLKMETEPCSICLENLSGSKLHGFPTRMSCSHVFHSRCLLEWLERKNTCPLCRAVLYDR